MTNQILYLNNIVNCSIVLYFRGYIIKVHKEYKIILFQRDYGIFLKQLAVACGSLTLQNRMLTIKRIKSKKCNIKERVRRNNKRIQSEGKITSLDESSFSRFEV